MGSPALDAVKGKTSTPVQPIRRQPVEEKPVADEKKLTPEQIATKKADEAKKDVVIGTALLKGSAGENIRASIPAVAGNYVSNIWNNPQRNVQNNNLLFSWASVSGGRASFAALTGNSGSESNSGDSHEGRNHNVALSKHIAKDSADGMEDVRFKKLELMG